MGSEHMGDLQRTDRKIQLAHGGVRGVLAIEAEWDSMTEDEQIDFSLEWDQDVGTITVIERQYQSGGLTEEQVAAYGRLKADLRRALPILEELELQKPRHGERFS